MKVFLTFLHIGIVTTLFDTNMRLRSLEERIKFVCSLPIVANKSVLLLDQRDGKWVFDNEIEKSFYYVPSGC